MKNSTFNRRQFIYSGSAAVASILFLPRFAIAKSANIIKTHEKSLDLYNTHTGESFKGMFWADGSFDPQALQDLNHLLRDRRTNDTIDMNKKLFELLSNLAEKLDTKKPLHIISGYRSKKSNDRLRRIKRGVARNSRHITGDAVDFKIPGVRLRDIRKAALAEKAGGVGYYPRSGFVHVDIREKPARW